MCPDCAAPVGRLDPESNQTVPFFRAATRHVIALRCLPAAPDRNAGLAGLAGNFDKSHLLVILRWLKLLVKKDGLASCLDTKLRLALIRASPSRHATRTLLF